MSLLKSRKKTTRSPRKARGNGDFQKLHINVSSPKIVMFQVMSGFEKGLKVIMLIALLGLIGWGGYRGLHHLFLGNEKYKLQEIDLQTNGHLDHTRLVEIAGIDLDVSIFAIKGEEVKTKLKALPEVIDCEVERRLPGTLKVIVTERVPAVWLESLALGYPGRKDGGILADAEGITFPCEGNMWNSARDLPVIVVNDVEEDSFRHGSKMKHTEVIRALHLINNLEQQNLRAQWHAERVILVNDYSLEVICRDGSCAIFGMYDHARQVADFVSVFEHSLQTNRMIQHINLIPKKNIPVKFAGDAIMVKPRRRPTPVNSDIRQIESILDRD